MKMFFRTLTGCLFVLVLSCSVATPEPVTPTPMPEVIVDTSECTKACDNLRKLGCSEGDPIVTNTGCVTTDDCPSFQRCESGRCVASCEVFCNDTQTQGVWLDPTCVAEITGCERIDSCPIESKE